MASNYVSILVKAIDDAKPDLDELRARLEELKHEVAEARVNVDDADAAAKLDRLQARLIDLNHKIANPNIKVSGALKAEAEIHAVEAAMDRLKAKADELKVEADAAGPGGLLGRLLGGIGGGGGGGGIASLAAGGLTSPAGIALITAGIATLLPEITGLASGFAAAGAGAGAFYLLAHPAISNLTQDTQNLLSAEEKLQQAQNLEAVAPSKAHLKALQAAADNLKAVQLSMSQDAGGAAQGVIRLREEWDKLTTAFQPEVFKVANAGLKLLGDMLPLVTPFAKTFADVFGGLLHSLDRSLFPQQIEEVSRGMHGIVGAMAGVAPSNGLQQFLDQFHKLEGPALTAIGKGLGEVIVQFSKLLTVMSAKDVVNAINIAFSVLSGTIDAFRHVVEAIMRAWDVSSATMARDARQVATAFDSLRHDIANIGHDLASYFDESRANVARWALDVQRDADNVVKWFQQLPGRIVHALGDIGSLLVQAGRDLVAGFIRGIESMFGAIASAAEGMVSSLGSKVLHLLHIGSPSRVAHWWGQMVAQGLADGIADHARLPADAAARMAAGVAGSLGGTGGYGGAGGQLTIQLQVTGGGTGLDQMFLTWLKNSIRAAGGDPRILNKKVAFQ